MGKQLIIKGADFSANRLFKEVDLTSLFTFTSGAYNSEGYAQASTSFIKSSTIDVSDYVENTMNISFCKYTSSGGGQSPFYGLFFYDADDQIIYVNQVPLGTDGPGRGRSIDMNIIIPDNAVKFKTVYLAEGVFAGEATPFYCIIRE